MFYYIYICEGYNLIFCGIISIPQPKRVFSLALSAAAFLGLHPICDSGDILFLLNLPAAAAFCFCSHSKTPALIISNICSLHIGPGEFAWYFFCVFQFFQQNPIWPPNQFFATMYFCFNSHLLTTYMMFNFKIEDRSSLQFYTMKCFFVLF